LSVEENKALIRKGIEAINEQKNFAILDDLAAPDYIDHSNQLNREGAKQFYTILLKGFPDYYRKVEDITAEGDKVWVHSTTKMTHTGEFRGVAPTGNKVTITGLNIYRIVDGKMVEGWSVTDSLDLLTQLGLIEYTDKGKKFLPEAITPQRSILKRENVKIEKRRLNTLDKNKAIIRSLYEADNKKDLSILDELLSPDFFEITLQMRGPEAYKQFEMSFFKGFPNWYETINDIIAEGDKVWVYFKATGTHTGNFRKFTPTGKKITITAVQMWRLVDGKVVEKQTVADELTAFIQLGVIVYTEKGKKIFPDDVSVRAVIDKPTS
jgi:predicted ester cyclase